MANWFVRINHRKENKGDFYSEQVERRLYFDYDTKRDVLDKIKNDYPEYFFDKVPQRTIDREFFYVNIYELDSQWEAFWTEKIPCQYCGENPVSRIELKGTLRKRLKKGMSVEEAVEAPRNQIVKNREVISYKGKTYKMWSEFLEENPLFKRARSSIQQRRERGMSIEEALDDYAKKNFVTDHKGNVFRNNTERSLEYGLNPTTVRNRLMLGWSLEKALTTPTK